MIDVIKWSSNAEEYIAASLSPAKVLQVDLDEENKVARVVVPDFQLSLAIGKEGQNARLAAKLTGWKIDIKSESQLRDHIESQLFTSNSFYGEDEDGDADALENQDVVDIIDATDEIAEVDETDEIDETAEVDEADETDETESEQQQDADSDVETEEAQE
jgi:N utilization substance protein A